MPLKPMTNHNTAYAKLTIGSDDGFQFDPISLFDGTKKGFGLGLINDGLVYAKEKPFSACALKCGDFE